MFGTKSVVIPAAGLGTRMGMNLPKSLLRVKGKYVIEHQINLIRSISESIQIIVVVGYRARDVIKVASAMDKNIIFAINHDFANTATAASLKIGAKYANDRIVALDGDLLVSKESLISVMSSVHDTLGIFSKKSETPVSAMYDEQRSSIVSIGYEVESDYEWSGLMSLSRDKVLEFHKGHVFENLINFLPLPFEIISGHEFDTENEFRQLETWMENN